MKWFRDLSIKIKLSIVFAVTMLTLISICACFLVNFLTRALISEAKERYLQKTAALMTEVDIILAGFYNCIIDFSQSGALTNKENKAEDIKQYLARKKNEHNFDSLSYFNSDRIRIADTDNIGIGTQHPIEGFWLDVLNGKISAGNDIRFGSERKVPVIFFAAPVYGAKEEGLIGAVVGRVNIAQFDRILKNIKFGGLQAFIIDGKRRLIYSNREDFKKRILKELPESAAMKKALNGEEGTVFEHLPALKGEFLTAYVPEKGYGDFTGNNWFFLVSVAKERVLAPILKLRNLFLFLLGIIFAVIILTAWIFGTALSRPLLKLTGIVKRIANEDLDIEIKYDKTRKDEIGQLSGAFETMVQDLRKSTVSVVRLNQEVSERRQMEARQALLVRILDVLNQRAPKVNTIQKIITLIKEFIQFDAIGIRVKEGEDFPYYQTNGFPEEFVKAETYLCGRDQKGELIRDSQGNPYLKCMCGNIICGRTDPKKPFFTQRGSFWTNCTTELLATTPEARTRNRCNGEGYDSVALIPLRSDDNIIGLLQLNDKRKNMLTPGLIEFFEEVGNCIGIALLHQEAEERLRQAEEKYRVMVEYSNDLIWVLDRNGNFTYINKKAEESSGYKLADVLGKSFAPMIPPETLPRITDIFIETLNGKPQQYEVLVCGLNGSNFMLSVNTAPIYENGKSVGTVSFGRDITAHKKMEQELGTHRDHLENLVKQRTQDLEVFCCAVSHDLQAPLRAIEAFSREIAKSGKDKFFDQECQDLFFRITANAKNMKVVINKLISMVYYQQMEVSKTGINMQGLLEETYEYIQETLSGRKVNFQIKAMPDAYADPILLKEVFLNYLTNALKFTAKREITQIEAGGWAEEKENVYYVKDNGAGFDMKYIDKLFIIFQRVHSPDEFQGTGIGLSLVKRLVGMHGGRVWAEGKVGEGATFYLSLPKQED
ncbi:MAG: PAS domain S-box protein [Candidatus Omnitrophica bacterium]|nr:PAS domain S-box protein [Candidatus Omnitrophota bacterium]MCG2703216.1 PAS domain S-box protein [Candidatus Omnitrophota bacterium]